MTTRKSPTTPWLRVMVTACLAVLALMASSTPVGAHHNPASPTNPQAIKIGITSTPTGDVLTNAQGHTLYAFLRDITDQGATDSVCDAACSRTRRPLPGGAQIGANHPRPMRTFAFERADGTTQTVIGQWPAYTFTGDTKPGHVNGHEPNGHWRAISASGALMT